VRGGGFADGADGPVRRHPLAGGVDERGCQSDETVVPVDRACGGTPAGGPPPAGGATALSGRTLTSGPWKHVDPPGTIPGWIDCPGFSGILAYSHDPDAAADDADTHLVVRGVAFPDSPHPGYGVVVDLLVDDTVREQLRRETGVELKSVRAAPPRDANAAQPLVARDGGDEHRRVVLTPGILNALPSLMEYRDWKTGATGPMTVTPPRLCSTRPMLRASLVA